jgi:hypothetical protein
MQNKRIGNLEITTYRDSEWVHITMHYNASVTAQIELRSNEDVLDLEYAIACVKVERNDILARAGKT